MMQKKTKSVAACGKAAALKSSESAFTSAVRTAKRRPGRPRRDETMPSEKALRTKDAIITAARMIVQNEGVDALSMEHVAEVAHMSKGAVTYHFRSKKALNMALLEDYADHLKKGLDAHEKAFIGKPDEAFVPAYADWYRDFEKADRGWAQIGIHLLSQQVKEPELVEPVRSWYSSVAERVAEMPEESRARVMTAVLALEGLFFVHKFGLDAMSPETKEEVLSFITEELSPGKAVKKK